MRPGRLLLVAMITALTVGCARQPVPMAADGSAMAAAPADLDALMYANGAARRSPAPAVVVAPAAIAGPVAAAEPAVARAEPYTLNSGDRLRVVVFGQEGLSNSYIVDAGGHITMPLIGVVSARGMTTDQLAQAIAGRLRNGYIREPHVAIEVETYRPFFILGEVTAPGQYPYVPNMTVETAVAIAGGFTPRASHGDVDLTRTAGAQTQRSAVPLLSPVRPGDTITVKERWF
jgi:polysaccharide biosynthesis/export protein